MFTVAAGAVLQARQHMAREQVALGAVRVAGQDEGLDAEAGYPRSLARTWSGSPTMAAPAPERARPMPVHRPGSTNPSSSANSRSSPCRSWPCRRGMQGLAPDPRAGFRVQARDKAPRRGPRFRFCRADDHVRPVAEPQLAAVPRRAGAHVGDDGLDRPHRVRPHQEHVGAPGPRPHAPPRTGRRSRTADSRRPGGCGADPPSGGRTRPARPPAFPSSSRAGCA